MYNSFSKAFLFYKRLLFFFFFTMISMMMFQQENLLNHFHLKEFLNRQNQLE